MKLILKKIIYNFIEMIKVRKKELTYTKKSKTVQYLNLNSLIIMRI